MVLEKLGDSLRAALQRYRHVALSNRRQREATSADWQGLAFAIPLPDRI